MSEQHLGGTWAARLPRAFPSPRVEWVPIKDLWGHLRTSQQKKLAMLESLVFYSENNAPGKGFINEVLTGREAVSREGKSCHKDYLQAINPVLNFNPFFYL